MANPAAIAPGWSGPRRREDRLHAAGTPGQGQAQERTDPDRQRQADSEPAGTLAAPAGGTTIMTPVVRADPNSPNPTPFSNRTILVVARSGATRQGAVVISYPTAATWPKIRGLSRGASQPDTSRAARAPMKKPDASAPLAAGPAPNSAAA